jgi:hypothetical protein
MNDLQSYIDRILGWERYSKVEVVHSYLAEFVNSILAVTTISFLLFVNTTKLEYKENYLIN